MNDVYMDENQLKSLTTKQLEDLYTERFSESVPYCNHAMFQKYKMLRFLLIRCLVEGKTVKELEPRFLEK